MKYDVLYQRWVEAKREKDYVLADQIREEFERLHGLTIFAEGDLPVEGVTVRRMKAWEWERKYGDKELSEVILASPRGDLIQDKGYHYDIR